MRHYDLINQNKFSSHQKIVKLVGQQKRVLDVGCSVGNISERIKKNECEVVGIELDKKSAKKAKPHCKDVFIGDVESINLNKKYEKYFDFIIFADILEHLKDPGNVLTRFKKYLKDDGYIIISLPNVANWRNRLNLFFGNFEYKDYGLLDRNHIRFFNEKGAKNLIEKGGFEIINFDMTVNIYTVTRLFYMVGRLWPNLLAFQFLITARKKD